MYGLAEYEVSRQRHEDTRDEVAMGRPATLVPEDREAGPYVVRDLSWELGRYLDTQSFPASASAPSLTSNEVNDFRPTLSPDGTKVVYTSAGIQTSNPEGDEEVYVMNTLDGTGKKNLTNNGTGVYDYSPDWGSQAT